MKIQIEAYLYAPGLLQWIGPANPAIFTGVFQKKFSTKEEAEFKFRNTITCKGVELTIRKNKKGIIFTCDGQLPSVSVHFFKKLKKSGWKMNKKVAVMYGFPSDEQNKKLREEIKKHRDENERILRTQKHCRETCDRMTKKLAKQMFPFKKFPQVH